MKKIIALAIAAASGLATGIPIGWLLRKKTAEVQFVETTDEEQRALMIANGDGELIPVAPVSKDSIKRPENLQKAIDGIFMKADVPEDLKEKVGEQIENEANLEAGIRQMDTQKVQYFKQWKAEELASQYDTRSDEVSEDVTELPLEAKEFAEEAEQEEYDEDEHYGDGRPEIEDADENEWDRWESKKDPAYDPVVVYWFDEDDVCCDIDEIEIDDKYLGFDVKSRFMTVDPSDPDKPDIRYVYNHKQHAIFQIIRRHTSFSRKRGMEEYGGDYDGDEDDSDEYLRSRV